MKDDEKQELQIRYIKDYDEVNTEIMNIFDKHELNYVEALGVLETLKAQIFAGFMKEDEQ